MELEKVRDWLWCLRTPIVQAYGVRERDGFNLIDTTTAGMEDAILAALDPAAAAASARRLANLHAEAMCFGHGEPLLDDAAARLAQVASRL